LINDFSTVIGGAERLLENLLLETQKEVVQFYRIDIADLFQVYFSEKTNSFLEKYRRVRIYPGIVRKLTEQIKAIQPDLIHLNNNNLLTNSIAMSLYQADIPVVYFIHDYYALRRLRSLLYARHLKGFIFLTHASDIYDRLKKMGKKAYLVKVPFNPILWATSISAETPQPLADLLYVGRLEKHKGIFLLVRAVEEIRKKIPTISLVILGDGSQRKMLERMVNTKNLTANIQIKGLQGDQEIIKYYTQSKILVFPSPAETLGYVGLEAQSCGVPVVAFHNHGTMRWCKDNHNGFMVNGRTYQKLAQKVMEIIDDDVLLNRISTAARENISLEKYNASSQTIMDIYKVVLLW
jgi:glycosyltransferase involved in cell wall biosynthesis